MLKVTYKYQQMNINYELISDPVRNVEFLGIQICKLEKKLYSQSLGLKMAKITVVCILGLTHGQ
jgi:hypothetical protein